MSSSDADLIDFYFPLLRQTSRRAVNGANICNCLPNMHYWLQKLPKHDIINLSINFPFFNTRRHKNQDPKILTSFRMLSKIYIFDCCVMARIGIVFIFFFFFAWLWHFGQHFLYKYFDNLTGSWFGRHLKLWSKISHCTCRAIKCKLSFICFIR